MRDSRVLSPETIAHNDGWDEGYTVGLSDGRAVGKVDAMAALSDAGLHDARCLEPRRPCTCGIDAAIQDPPDGLPVSLNRMRAWRDRVLSSRSDLRRRRLPMTPCRW